MRCGLSAVGCGLWVVRVFLRMSSGPDEDFALARRGWGGEARWRWWVFATAYVPPPSAGRPHAAV